MKTEELAENILQSDKLYILLNLFKELPEALQDQMLKEIISTAQESENTSQ